MARLFASEHVADLILGFMVLEYLVLAVYFRRTGRGIAPRELVANFLAGAALLMAVRVALSGGGWIWMASSLLGALFAHAYDLGVRWRSPFAARRRRGTARPLT